MFKNKTFWYAIATLLGTIIGVGMFGLPYVSSRAGFGVMVIYFILLTILAIATHLIYGEVALRTRGKHRFCGYAERYLGQWGKKATLISTIFGYYGTLFVYILVGGKFLFSLFSPCLGGNELTYSILFFIAGAILIYRGAKGVALVEFLMMILFFAALAYLFIIGGGKINLANFSFMGTDGLRSLFLPYGIIVFALWGSSIIPELKDMLAAKPELLKKVIVWSVIVAALTYLLFIFLVQGISGTSTTQDGLLGLFPYLGQKALNFAFLFGILATFTSFLSLGLTLEKIFRYDFQIQHFYSWSLAVLTPLAFVLLGFEDFIGTMSIVGAVGLAFEMFILLLVHKKAKKTGDFKPAYSVNLSSFWFWFITAVVSLGALAEIFFEVF